MKKLYGSAEARQLEGDEEESSAFANEFSFRKLLRPREREREKKREFSL